MPASSCRRERELRSRAPDDREDAVQRDRHDALVACGSSGGRRRRPASEYGAYVAVTGTKDGATAAAGPFMLPGLSIASGSSISA